MVQLLGRMSALLLVLLLLPSTASAQFTGAITGVVKDASGGVLPGVTVEAASPVLIEKVRSVVTDDTGQYRIVDLRPGTYSVTFTLPGFSTVRREGIEIAGTFVATVNGDLKVGALEETITVTGETPIVDVQSVQRAADGEQGHSRRDSHARDRRGGIQALIPGMSSGGDSGGITGGGGSAGHIHGGRGDDSRTYSDGLNIGWAGGGGGRGGMGSTSPARRKWCSARRAAWAKRRRAGVILNVIPREGGNTFSGSVRRQRRERRDAGQQLHAVAEGPGPEGAVRAHQRVRDQSDGRRPHRPRQALVLPVVPPDRDGQHGPRHVGQQERRQPERLDASISTRAGRRFTIPWIESGPAASRGRRRRATRSTSAGQEQIISANWKGGGTATTTPKRSTGALIDAVAPAGRDLVVADHEPAAARRRAGARSRRGIAIPRRGPTARTIRG